MLLVSDANIFIELTLVREMLASAITSAEELHESIQLMKRHGRRLPWDELEALVRLHGDQG